VKKLKIFKQKYYILFVMINNKENFNKYCEDNNIELIENYDNVKMKREIYIKGSCKSITDTCEKTFNKNFRQLVKTGPYCYKYDVWVYDNKGNKVDAF